MAVIDKSLFIADASVFLKWCLEEEEDREQASRFFRHLYSGEIHISVPAHCFTEVENILALKAPVLAIPFLSQLLMTSIVQHRLSLSLASLAFKLTQKYPHISFYDASYHALAIQEKGTFITCDTRYFQIAKKEGHIRLLKNYQTPLTKR